MTEELLQLMYKYGGSLKVEYDIMKQGVRFTFTVGNNTTGTFVVRDNGKHNIESELFDPMVMGILKSIEVEPIK